MLPKAGELVKSGEMGHARDENRGMNLGSGRTLLEGQFLDA